MHIEKFAGRCFYQLRELRSVRNPLTSDASKTMIQAFVSSCVYYCNSIVNLMRTKNLRPFQTVLNATTHVISSQSKYNHISDVIHDQLHWLPIIQRTERKLYSLVFKGLYQSGPKYVSEMR